jgi:hypothetical protein
MHAIWALALLAAASGGAPPPRADPLIPLGSFSVTTPGGLASTDVEISSVLITNTTDARPETTWINEKAERVWVAIKRVVKAGAAPNTQWIDGRNCYQLIETLTSLVDLEALPAPGKVMSDTKIEDGAYQIQMPGLIIAANHPADIRLRSGKSAPARVVVGTALNALAPCWSDTPPTFGATF